MLTPCPIELSPHLPVSQTNAHGDRMELYDISLSHGNGEDPEGPLWKLTASFVASFTSLAHVLLRNWTEALFTSQHDPALGVSSHLLVTLRSTPPQRPRLK